MLIRSFLFGVSVLAINAAHAQSPPSPAQMGITTTLPQQLMVLDKNNAWVPIGSFMPGGAFVANGALDPRQFGAACDGVRHDEAELAAWAAAGVDGSAYFIPGSCLTATPIVFPKHDNVSIAGSGRGSEIRYVGAPTNVDIVTIGDASADCAVNGLKLTGFRVATNTVMASGSTALHIKHLCDGTIENFVVGGEFGAGSNNFAYSALWLDGGNSVRLRGVDLNASQNCLFVNGTATAQFTDLYYFHGKIDHCGVGVDIAGNVGGYNLDGISILENGVNFKVSQDRVAVANSQGFFGPMLELDATVGGAGLGLWITDPGGLESIITSSGSWFASAEKQGILIGSTVTQLTFNMTGGNLINNNDAGSAPAALDNQATNANVIVNLSGTHISQCCAAGAYAINNVAATPIRLQGVIFDTSSTNRIQGAWSGCWTDSGNEVCGNSVVKATITDLLFQAPNNANGLNLKLTGNGSLTSSKTLRVRDAGDGAGGRLELTNDAYTRNIATWHDTGDQLTAPLVTLNDSGPTNTNLAFRQNAGVSGSSAFNGAWPINYFQIGDTSSTEPSPNSLLTGLYVALNLNPGAKVTHNGGKNALVGAINVNTTPTTTCCYGGAPGLVGLAGYGFAGAPSAGTGTTGSTSTGGIGAANLISRLGNGATNWNFNQILEADISNDAGSSVYGKEGILVAQLPTDKVAGVGVDCGYCLANQAGAVGWKYGWSYGVETGYNPVQATGTIFGCPGQAGLPGNCGTVADGIDLRNSTFTDMAFASPSFSVTGAGALTAASFKSGAAVGVSCPAGTVNLTTLVVTNGIVTHC